jgi:crotonobetainyl-CoA:carnitine CoA-transferase CaiB-like acyl-CoA transferase
MVQDAGYGIFKAGDGLAFTLGIAHEDWFWDRLCLAMGLTECHGVRALERRMRRRELVEKLQNIFFQKTREEWVKILTEADVPVSPVQKLAEVAKDPQVLFREMVKEISLSTGERLMQTGVPIKLSETPGKISLPPPELGEHTTKTLESLGYTRDEIVKLEKERVI